MITPDKFRFFLDSGAFSAWSRGAVIDLDEYCEFIRANIDRIDAYASLDVIPGKPGKPATTKDRDLAADQSWANYQYMKEQGLDPLPVYHYGEHTRHLDRILKTGVDYIGIGGLVGVSGPMRRAWLDRIFDILTDDEGRPLIKTHGFGMTAVPLMFRYPWHSVDSATWIQITASGSIYVPPYRDGQFIFDEVPNTVAVSERSPKAAQSGKHITSMSPAAVKVVKLWLERCGKTLEQVGADYYPRATCNVLYFKSVSERARDRKFEKNTKRRGVLL